METIAERIRKGLSIRNMRQTDLVEKTGIGKSSISTYLSGEYEPKQRNIYKIAQALDVSEAWLMGYDVPMERKIAVEVTKEEQNLLINFQSLNDTGKFKAFEYVADLADNPKYSDVYVPEVLAAHHETGLPNEDDMKHIDAVIDYVGKDKGEL